MGKKTKSIAEALNSFLFNANKTKKDFKVSNDVISDLLNKVSNKLSLSKSGNEPLTNSSLASIQKNNMTGIFSNQPASVFGQQKQLVIITHNGTINKTNNLRKMSLSPVAIDSLVKMLEFKFEGNYPGKYNANDNLVSIIDSQYVPEKLNSSSWQLFSLNHQLNKINDLENPYIDALVHTLSTIDSYENKQAFVDQHIRYQVSQENKLFICEQRMLQYLKKVISTHNVVDTSNMNRDPSSFVNSFNHEYDLLIDKPLLHDALKIESNNMDLLSIDGLGSEEQRQKYIDVVKLIVSQYSSSEEKLKEGLDRLNADIFNAVGGESTLKRIKENVETNLYVDPYPELTPYQAPTMSRQ